ncbi:MAG: hypothetical protein AAGD05_01615 [Bacteroidota bacterium]
MQLQCPQCNHAIQSDDVHLASQTAKCSNCHAIFNFSTALETETVPMRPEIFLPKGMEILKLRSELELQISWRDTLNSFLVFFTIVWNIFVLPFAIFAILSGELMILLGLSLHLAVGIGLLYYIITAVFNTTFVTVDHHHLHIEHRPLKVPFYPNQDFPVMDIDQIYVNKYVKSKTNGRPDYAFSVEAILKNKRHVRLVRGLQHPDQALYVEQEIERFLQIKDRPVTEEWKG